MPQIRLLAVLLVSALVGSPVHAHHTTDHTMQQLEYERQQREYWRQQEQKREEERRQQQIWQDNARRQQEESNRARASTPKSSADELTPSRGSGAPRSSGGDAGALCKAHPLRAGERNPLIGGQWRPVNAPTGDAFTQLFQMATLGVCAVFQAGIEFRERTHVNAIGEFPVRYGHKGDVWFACFPETTYGFRVEEANQVAVLGAEPACRLRREGAQLAQATSAPSGATVAGTATSSAAAAGAAVLALSAAIAPNGASVPVSGGSFFVLKSSVESVMERAGIPRAPNGSHVKGWQIACDSGAPACRQGANALIGASVAVAKTDAGGRTRTTPVAPGRYYVFGAAPTASPLFWNVQVDLKPGSNTIALDQSNATPLN